MILKPRLKIDFFLQDTRVQLHPKEYQPHMKCIVDLEGVESADDAPDTSYYQ